ncbi:MAG: retropepsin-like aspartic protease [Phycisphaerae bacterium]
MRTLSSLLASLVFVALIVPLAPADEYVRLGPSDGAALDQPRVAVEIYDPGPPEESFGPTYYNHFLLDTGANSILFGYIGITDLSAGYQVEPGVTYVEQGLAGSVELDVSLPYGFDFAGSDGQRRTLSDTQVLSTTDSNVLLGGFPGIVGMPAMVGRVTSLDNTTLADPDYMGVGFSDTVPADDGHRYTIPLQMKEFEQSGQQNPADPTPVWAPLPFARADFQHNGSKAGDSLLFDTGAQLSIISSELAFAAGLDTDGDGNFDNEKVDEMEIGGLGGSDIAPLLVVEYMELPTEEGPALRLTDVPILVYDIHESIPGVLGCEVLTSGWTATAFSGGPPGYIEQAHFDFRDADQLTGELLLDLNPDVDVVIPEPATAVLLACGWLWVLKRRQRTLASAPAQR